MTKFISLIVYGQSTGLFFLRCCLLAHAADTRTAVTSNLVKKKKTFQIESRGSNRFGMDCFIIKLSSFLFVLLFLRTNNRFPDDAIRFFYHPSWLCVSLFFSTFFFLFYKNSFFKFDVLPIWLTSSSTDRKECPLHLFIFFSFQYPFLNVFLFFSFKIKIKTRKIITRSEEILDFFLLLFFVSFFFVFILLVFFFFFFWFFLCVFLLFFFFIIFCFHLFGFFFFFFFFIFCVCVVVDFVVVYSVCCDKPIIQWHHSNAVNVCWRGPGTRRPPVRA